MAKLKFKITKRRAAIGTVALAASAAIGIAGTGAAHAAATPVPASLYADGTSAATLNSSGNPVLTHGTSGSAQVDLRLHSGTAAPATAPAFTASSTAAFNFGPAWYIALHNGTSMYGAYPAADGSGLKWYANPGGPQGVTYAAALAWAQKNGADDTVTQADVINATVNSPVTFTSVTYGGSPVVVKPVSAPVPRFSHGHAVSTAPTRETVYFTDSQAGVVQFKIYGPYFNGHTGWVHAVKGVNAGYYWGLAANHGYYVVYTAYTAVNGSPILRANGTPDSGTVYFVSNR